MNNSYDENNRALAMYSKFRFRMECVWTIHSVQTWIPLADAESSTKSRERRIRTGINYPKPKLNACVNSALRYPHINSLSYNA
jgi:hypothetical protein